MKIQFQHSWVFIFIGLVSLTLPAYAERASAHLFAFESLEQQTAFDELTRELRCLVCQNQSIAESNAPLAQDLKSLVKTKLEQGESKKEILNYLKERYGEFVHYKPGIQKSTWLLWFGPVMFLLLSGIVIVRLVTKASANQDNAVGDL